MKNTLCTLLAFLPLFAYSQFSETEHFEDFILVPNNWGFFDIAGFDERWAPTEVNNLAQPPYAGNQAIYIAPGTMPEGELTDDWLMTPRFTAQADTQLSFYSRLQQEGDQGSMYGIYISTQDVQLYPEGYTLLQEWTEPELNPNQLTYNHINVPIPAQYVGQQIYLAFRMRTNGGDGWLIDDASIASIMASQSLNRQDIALYPNPVSDRLNVVLANDSTLRAVTVYDLNGRLCLSADTVVIDTQQLSTGIYAVKIETDSASGYYKLIKQ